MNKEEKEAINDLKRTVELYEAKPIDKISVEFDEFDYKIVKIILKLINKQQKEIEKRQKENEKYKRLAKMNLKNAEEFKNNMCEHRCLLKNENEELQKENEELKKFITEGITVVPHSPYKNYRLDFLRENFVSKQRIKNEISKMQTKYRILDKEIDKALEFHQTIQDFYITRQKSGELQDIKYFIETLEEILGEKEGK